MNEGRRPITEAERPHAEALGRLLRSLRDEAALTQPQLGALATLQGSTISALERGRRRTRRSTLVRLVGALVAEHRREAILAELVEAAGPALAPESTFAERLARRQARRERAELPKLIATMREVLPSVRRLARRSPEGNAQAQVLEFEQRLADLEAQQRAPAARSDQSNWGGPASDPARPAWSAWQAYAWEVMGGLRGQRMITDAALPVEVRRRLSELRAAAEAEKAAQA